MNATLRLAGDDDKRKPIPARFVFTEARVASAKGRPGKKQTTYHDERVRGLVLIVTGQGVRTYYLYRKLNGRPVRVWLGTPHTMTVDQARRAAIDAHATMNAGIDPVAERAQKRKETAAAAITLETLWQKYDADFVGPRCTPRTAETHRGMWNAWLSRWAKVRADAVDDALLRTIHATVNKGYRHPKTNVMIGGPRAANKAIATLRRLFNFNRLPNPVTPGSVELFRQHSRERFLDAAELARFLAAVDAEKDRDAAEFLRLSLFTGARRSNVAAMAWAEIDFASKVWVIPPEKFKTRKVVTLPLSPPAMEILERRRAENDHRATPSPYVFPSISSATGYRLEYRTAFKRVCKAAGVANLRLHDLRRTLGSWQAAGGASLSIIGKSLGHANIATTQIYGRLDLTPVRASVEAATAAMLGTSKTQEAPTPPTGKHRPKAK